MKHYLFLFILASQLVAAPIAYHNIIASDNALLHYKFDEASGSTITNYGTLGSSHNGTISGDQISLNTTTDSGDTGVTFSGITSGTNNDFIASNTVAPTSLTGNATFSIETVVFIPNGASSQSYPTFMHWGANSTANSVFFGPRRSDNNIIYAGFHNGGMMQNGTVSLGEWHHIVMTREGGNNSNIGTSLYIDGVNVPLTVDTSLSVNANSLVPNLTSTVFAIGKPDSGNRFFNLTMDEVAVYDRELSASEVGAHFVALNNDATVPEPSSWLLITLGLLVGYRTKKV